MKSLAHNIFVILPFALLMVSPYTSMGAPVVNHFVDANGSALPRFAFIWDQLSSFYGDAVPATITVVQKDFGDGTSRFDCSSNTAYINPASYQAHANRDIAHESSHLSMCNLTHQASLLEQFRFFDEGFANLQGYTGDAQADAYKQLSMIEAGSQYQKQEVSFAKVQNWAVYFGADVDGELSNSNPFAYPVGSSFDYFLSDTYSMDKLRAFFVSIGQTKDLSLSLLAVFGVTEPQGENAWLNYLSAVDLSAYQQPPAIVQMTPTNGSTHVSTSLTEITVTFNVEMSPTISIAAPCDAGLCYTNASWKDPKTLVIKVSPSLQANHQYTLKLGNQHLLSSVLGSPLPVMPWTFETQ